MQHASSTETINKLSGDAVKNGGDGSFPTEGTLHQRRS